MNNHDESIHTMVDNQSSNILKEIESAIEVIGQNDEDEQNESITDDMISKR